MRRCWFFQIGLALGVIAGRPDPGFGADAKPIDPSLLQRFEARVFRDPAGGELNYRWFKPNQGTAKTNLPLVVFLHGAAGLGSDNQRQFNGGNEVPPQALTAEDAQARFPSYVLAPQCPRGESWSAIGREPARSVRLTLAAIEALRREFPLDPRRFYLIGVSMGGNGVWEVASRFPNTFAAVVPICGSGNTASAARLVHLPIWCFHGAADPLIPASYASEMVAAVRKAGGNPRYTEYPGVGHDSYRNAFKDEALLPWLFSQQRSPAGTNAP